MKPEAQDAMFGVIKENLSTDPGLPHEIVKGYDLSTQPAPEPRPQIVTDSIPEIGPKVLEPVDVLEEVVTRLGEARDRESLSKWLATLAVDTRKVPSEIKPALYEHLGRRGLDPGGAGVVVKESNRLRKQANSDFRKTAEDILKTRVEPEDLEPFLRATDGDIPIEDDDELIDKIEKLYFGSVPGDRRRIALYEREPAH